MAPNLTVAQRQQVADLLQGHQLSDLQIAARIPCTDRAVRRIRTNLQCFDRPTAPCYGRGRPRTLKPAMMQFVCLYLETCPDRTLDELVTLVQDEFGVSTSSETIRRELTLMNCSRKILRRVAQEQNQDLRDAYVYQTAGIAAEQFVFVDESGCDRRTSQRTKGWAPRGRTPVKRACFQRGQRYQILPAYTCDGVLEVDIFLGSTDASIFENFIRRVLQQCQPWPGPHSVLVMDNASIHRSDEVRRLCHEAGVKLIYLPPYSPDRNPIEEFFAELKNFIRVNWSLFKNDPSQDFTAFLRSCIEVVGNNAEHARGHFRNAGIVVE